MWYGKWPSEWGTSMCYTGESIFNRESLSSSEDMTLQKCPDGGWGWVIVTASFFIQFLCYGSPLAVGILYVEWLDIFQAGKGKTAWIGSLAAGVGLLASPICSLCVLTFGTRPVIFFSGLIVAGGLMLSSVAPSIYFLFFSYGILVGLGCGLLYTATITATCQYFDKRRGLALGLISTGSSLGLFIYAVLQKELIELYEVEGCLMVVGAISLNILPCGILMRPLESRDTSTLQEPYIEGIRVQNIIYHVKDPNTEETLSILEKNSNTANSIDLMCIGDSKKAHVNLNNALFSGDPVQTNTLSKKVADHRSLCKRIAKTKWHILLQYCEDTLLLFKNKVFAALFIAIFLYDIGGFPPTLLLEDIAKSANISEEPYFIPLVSIMGFSTVIGKFVLGLLADFAFINSLYLYVFTLLGTGLALLAIPFAQNYVTLAILAVILGFFSGNWSIFPYVTTKTVGLEKLTHAYGILMFFAGFGNCLGTPIVGWFYDWTQTYDIAFYFSGVCVFFGGLLLLLAALPRCSSQTPNKPPVYTHSYNAAPVA